jgi:hypothetical protein
MKNSDAPWIAWPRRPQPNPLSSPSGYFDGDRGAFEGKISDVDAFVPEAIYLEAIGAFTEATKLTLKLVHAWATQKDREEAAKSKSSSGESSI